MPRHPSFCVFRIPAKAMAAGFEFAGVGDDGVGAGVL